MTIFEGLFDSKDEKRGRERIGGSGIGCHDRYRQHAFRRPACAGVDDVAVPSSPEAEKPCSGTTGSHPTILEENRCQETFGHLGVPDANRPACEILVTATGENAALAAVNEPVVKTSLEQNFGPAVECVAFADGPQIQCDRRMGVAEGGIEIIELQMVNADLFQSGVNFVGSRKAEFIATTVPESHERA